MFADVVEYTRLVESNERPTVERIRALLEQRAEDIVRPLGGRVIRRLGDGLMLEFPDARVAAICAAAMHSAAAEQNAGLPECEKTHLRIGINSGDVLTDSRDIYGHGVNLTARIATLAGPGATVISTTARDQLTPGLDGEIEDLGECHVKHVAEPVRIYQLYHGQPRVKLPSDPVPLQPTIAVLPFRTEEGDVETGGLGDLIADVVQAGLTRSREMRVISRLSTQVFKGRPTSPQEVGASLQANYVLSGSARMLGGRMSIYAELSACATGQAIWAEQLAGEVADLLRNDSAMAGRICAQACAALQRSETGSAMAHPLPTLKSHTLLVGAVHSMYVQSRPSFERARAMLDHLIERHPRSATTYAWLGQWHVLNAAQGWTADPQRSVREGQEVTLRSLGLDAGNSLAWTVKGVLYGYFQGDHTRASQSFDHAIANNPNESMAWLQSGLLAGWRGARAQAVEFSTRAIALSPLDPHLYFYHSLAGGAHLGAGDDAGAERYSMISLRANRYHVPTYKILVLAQALQGCMGHARENARMAMTLSPAFNVASFRKSSPYRGNPRFEVMCEALAEAGVPPQ
jgi:class 3 adenylate cyclase/TolB-like protein